MIAMMIAMKMIMTVCADDVTVASEVTIELN